MVREGDMTGGVLPMDGPLGSWGCEVRRPGEGDEKGFIERDKKNLIATPKGKSLIEIVADNFKSAEMTAQWEMQLSDIAQGKSSKKEFLEAIEK